jgi:hypothetical protein
MLVNQVSERNQVRLFKESKSVSWRVESLFNLTQFIYSHIPKREGETSLKREGKLEKQEASVTFSKGNNLRHKQCE